MTKCSRVGCWIAAPNRTELCWKHRATTIRRTKPMRRKRARRIDRKTDAETHYTTWVHSRPCAGRGTIPFHTCKGPIQQAHIRDMTGLGLKASDFLSIALCRALHEEYDQAKGIFESYGKEGRKHWFYSRVIEFHADYTLEHGFPPEDWKLPKGMKL